MTTSVESGRAGRIYLQGPEVINTGSMTSDADYGQAGYVEASSQYKTWLGAGSVLSAAGGSGDADGGEVFVYAYSGDTVFSQGALIDVSGGELGGDGGTVFLGADNLLVNLGTVDVSAGPGGEDGVLTIEASDISTDPADDVDDHQPCDGDDDDDDDDDDDVSAELAGARPHDPQFEDSVQAEVHDLELLNRLQILGRAVRESEARDALFGRAIYNDLLTSPEDNADALHTAVTRIDVHAVENLVVTYNSIFGPADHDRTAEVGDTLASSFDGYMDVMSLEQASSVEPALFRSWLARQDDQTQSLFYVQQLERLLTGLQVLGLTQREYVEARDRILDAIAPSGGFDLEILLRVIEAGDQVAQTESESDLADGEAS